MKNLNEVKPITLRDSETGEVYTLEFDRETIKFAEARGFDIEEVDKFTALKLPELFWYAFRMHHKRVSFEQAERILYNDLGGLPKEATKRLIELWFVPQQALVQDEDEAKNAKMTVEL